MFAPVVIAASAEARAVFWAIVMLGVLVVGLVVFAMIRAVHKRSSVADDAPAGLTLHDLREMRARGELTEEEFLRAREIVLRQSGVAETPVSAPGAGADRPESGARSGHPEA